MLARVIGAVPLCQASASRRIRDSAVHIRSRPNSSGIMH
jgi:hypothetical protein